MGDDAAAQPPAKKRGATRQISKDDGSDCEDDMFVPSESNSFQKASEEVIATRRIVKVRRSAPAPPVPHAAKPPAANPFASIRLVAPTVSSGSPPTSVASLVPMAPSQESLEAVTGKDSVAAAIKTGAKNGVGVSGVQQGEADEKDNGSEADLRSKAGEEQTEVLEGNTEGTADVTEQQNEENGKGGSTLPRSFEIKSVNDQLVDASKDVLGEVVSGKSEVNEPACAVITDTGLGLIANDKEGLNDEEGTENAEVNGPPVSSVQADEDPVSLPAGHSTIEAGPLPALGGVIPGSFTFGTVPSSFEPPTAFASFSSTWSAFSSGIGTGANSGSGFAFSKVASEGAFSSASSAFGSSNGSSFQLFNTQSSGIPLSSGPPAQPPASAIQFQEGITQTGEEQEKVVFGGDATLFEFVDNVWKERGKGELRVNVPLDRTGKARLLMRSKGNYRLILNAGLFPDMKMTSMESRGMTFACLNSAVEEKSGLVTYAVKFKDSSTAGSFLEAVEANKCPSQGGLKTPENSECSS